MARQDLVQKTDAGLDLARALVDAARAEASRRGLALAVAIVDSGGQPVEAARMDGAQISAMPLAMDKAYTAVACGLPTTAWAARTQPGQADWGLNTALGGRLIAFAGGIPLYSGSSLVGGLGISGAAAHHDEAVAAFAVSACGLSASPQNDAGA